MLNMFIIVIDICIYTGIHMLSVKLILIYDY